MRERPIGVDNRQQPAQAEHVSGRGGARFVRGGQLEIVEQLVPLRGEALRGAGNAERVGQASLVPRGSKGAGVSTGFQASQLLDDRERGLPLLWGGKELALRADELQIRAQQPEAQHSDPELSEASCPVERGDRRMGCDHPVDLSSGRTIRLTIFHFRIDRNVRDFRKLFFFFDIATNLDNFGERIRLEF